MNKLVEVKELPYDFDKCLEERSTSYIEYIKDPNRFKCGEYTVTVEFTGRSDFASCLAQGLENVK
jgi:hypothetical protein